MKERFVGRSSPFVRYHLNQGLILFALSMPCGIGLGFSSAVLALIPILGWIASLGLSCGYLVTLFTFVALGISNAVGGRARPLPLIGGLFNVIQ